MSREPIIINVDDHEPARYAKSRTLSRAGFVVHEAATGAQALNLIGEVHPDLVLLDINLPDINGIEVCRRAKADASGSCALILQISASATAAPQATAALDSGADAYLSEPVDPEVLIATIRALLRLRRAERDLAEANERLQLLNRELHRSNEDLQQFAFVASHDLQEPLRTVISFVGLLERTAKTKLDGDELEYLGYISEGSRRMRLLINDLLIYSQVGQKPLSSRTIDLNAVLAWTLDDLREGISNSAAEITAESLPSITGDEAQFGHVFQNLIGNAIKYARPGVRPIIRLTSSRDNGTWTIAVSDNGIGIDPAYFQLIFAPFKRLHGKEISGTGIGLAVCRRVVEAHGGRIWVESTPGEGSTFYFTLPAAPETNKS